MLCVLQILSTNIAESSITIDDVAFVIDTGRVKEVTNNYFNEKVFNIALAGCIETLE